MKHQSRSIILRTVCGCERILEIPFRQLPETFSVPFIRRRTFAMTAADGDSCMTQLENRRIFERTGEFGIYNYPLYVEVLKDAQ